MVTDFSQLNSWTAGTLLGVSKLSKFNFEISNFQTRLVKLTLNILHRLLSSNLNWGFLVSASLPWLSFPLCVAHLRWFDFENLSSRFFRCLIKFLFCLPMADWIDPLQDLLCLCAPLTLVGSSLSLCSPYTGDCHAQQALCMGCPGNSHLVSLSPSVDNDRQVTIPSSAPSISPYQMTSPMTMYHTTPRIMYPSSTYLHGNPDSTMTLCRILPILAHRWIHFRCLWTMCLIRLLTSPYTYIYTYSPYCFYTYSYYLHSIESDCLFWQYVSRRTVFWSSWSTIALWQIIFYNASCSRSLFLWHIFWPYFRSWVSNYWCSFSNEFGFCSDFISW